MLFHKEELFIQKLITNIIKDIKHFYFERLEQKRKILKQKGMFFTDKDFSFIIDSLFDVKELPDCIPRYLNISINSRNSSSFNIKFPHIHFYTSIPFSVDFYDYSFFFDLKCDLYQFFNRLVENNFLINRLSDDYILPEISFTNPEEFFKILEKYSTEEIFTNNIIIFYEEIINEIRTTQHHKKYTLDDYYKKSSYLHLLKDVIDMTILFKINPEFRQYHASATIYNDKFEKQKFKLETMYRSLWKANRLYTDGAWNTSWNTVRKDPYDNII